MVSEKRYNMQNGKFEETKKNNWIIETDGVALSKVLAVENVDH